MVWRVVIDPIHCSGFVACMTECIKGLTSYDVRPNPDLLHPVQIDHKSPLIEYRPHMTPMEVHSVLGRAALHVIEPRWFPEFRRVTRLRRTDTDAATNGRCEVGHHPRLHCLRCKDRA